jgi:Na+/H+ antiporter NhaA
VNWRALACSGVLWRALACSGVHWRALTCTGVLWSALACSGVHAEFNKNIQKIALLRCKMKKIKDIMQFFECFLLNAMKNEKKIKEIMHFLNVSC